MHTGVVNVVIVDVETKIYVLVNNPPRKGLAVLVLDTYTGAPPKLPDNRPKSRSCAARSTLVGNGFGGYRLRDWIASSSVFIFHDVLREYIKQFQDSYIYL